MNYYESLINEGMASTRTDDIEKAMEKLHLALSKCDYSNRRLFFSKGIDDRLQEYARCTGLADVTDTGARVAHAYSPVKKDEHFYALVFRRDDPKAKIVCKDDGVTPITYPSYEDAESFCDFKNKQNGLSEGGIADIKNSSVLARAKLMDAQLHDAFVSGDESPVEVVIQKDVNGEFRVPGPTGREEAAAYYTSDRDDAKGTAQQMYGDAADIKFMFVPEHVLVGVNDPVGVEHKAAVENIWTALDKVSSRSR